MHTPLPKSYKGAYPFKIATTSFIYPDHMLANVEMLGPYVDEIELIFFESAPRDGLPQRSEIEQLALAAQKFDLTYNIHLPLDIDPGSNDSSVRSLAIKIIQKIIRLTGPLSPSTYTLHLPFHQRTPHQAAIEDWHSRIRQSLDRLSDTDIKGDLFSIETLDYPFEWLDEILTAFDIAVCIDAGHLLHNGFDLQRIFQKYASRTSIFHLHGVENDRDHVSLENVPPGYSETITEILNRFRGVVSIEVFSYQMLKTSLKCLERWMGTI